ncbi:hypothetical protein EMPS_00317 [Entomortierella parvispora]|uniref:Galactose oxidase n=1 Tax=Entomortierella parvispora TaxID=205924 RepID=A0A9P3H0H0_9FUNG|nr:hypothetical protein EMPS_00317 [Entomortierella parvispora]
MLMISSFDVLVTAQSPPATNLYVTTFGALSVTSKTQFFILGGAKIVVPDGASRVTAATPINQFIALDLTAAWNVSQPAWTNIGPPRYLNEEINLYSFRGGSLTISLDGKYLNTFGGFQDRSQTLGFQYTLAGQTWTMAASGPSSLLNTSYRAAQDRETGVVYLAEFQKGESAVQHVYTYDIAKNNIVGVSTIPTPVTSPWYSAVYSAYRRSLLYLSVPVRAGSSALAEFVPASNAWRTLVTEDGTKVVVLGGRLYGPKGAGSMLSDLWILDVPTMSWTQGPSAPQPRIGSACAIVNDTLINWGGSNGVDTNSPPILLFDLKTNTFVDQYKPTWPDTSTKTTNAATSASSAGTGTSTPAMNGNLDMNSDIKDGSHNQLAIIGGGAAGAILLLSAVAAGFCFYCQSRAWSSMGDQDGDETLSSYEKRSRYNSLNSETIPMRAEFLEQERQKWRGSTTSQGYMSPGGSPYDQISMEKAASSIDPADAFRAGAAAALEAIAISPKERERQLQILEAGFRERQSFIQAESQNARESALFRQSLNSSGVARNSFGTGAPLAVAINPSPFQSSSQYQGQAPAHQCQAPAEYQGQQWSTPLSPVTSPPQQHQGDQHRQSMQLMHLQEQHFLQKQQFQQEQYLL